MKKEFIGKLENFPKYRATAINALGKDIVVYRTDKKIHTFLNICSHEHFPLEDGEYDDNTVTCSHHGAKYDLATGKVLALPATSPIQIFKNKIEGGDVYLLIEDPK